MDRRKHQRVVWLLGLLFLVLAAEGILFYHAASELQQIESRRLGAYAQEMSEQEAVSIFNGKNVDGTPASGSGQEENVEAGKLLQEKYGYHWWETPYMQMWLRYIVLALGIGLLGYCLVWLLFQKQRKEESDVLKELERVREQLHELQIHFQRMKRQLEKEEQETKSLITDISHQLKTPMASLQMSHEILETTDLTEAERGMFRKKEEEELHKLSDLIKALLELSKLESKLIQLHPESVSLRKMLTEAVNGVYMKATEKQIDISLEEMQDVNLWLDSKWTGEAFANLLDNAVKYAPRQTEIYLRVTKMISYVLVEVEDQGIGITSEEAHQIFKRFYRGGNPQIKQQEGSGVGLYLARKIFEEQGGTICVKQAAVQGSIFQVTLPLEKKD